MAARRVAAPGGVRQRRSRRAADGHRRGGHERLRDAAPGRRSAHRHRRWGRPVLRPDVLAVVRTLPATAAGGARAAGGPERPVPGQGHRPDRRDLDRRAQRDAALHRGTGPVHPAAVADGLPGPQLPRCDEHLPRERQPRLRSRHRRPGEATYVSPHRRRSRIGRWRNRRRRRHRRRRDRRDWNRWCDGRRRCKRQRRDGRRRGTRWSRRRDRIGRYRWDRRRDRIGRYRWDRCRDWVCWRRWQRRRGRARRNQRRRRLRWRGWTRRNGRCRRNRRRHGRRAQRSTGRLLDLRRGRDLLP